MNVSALIRMAIVVVAIGAAAVREAIVQPRPSGLVIITLDTTRADRLRYTGSAAS